MPSITKLVPAKRRRGRVHVHIDASYAFTLPADLAAELSVGQPLSDSELAELQREAVSLTASERALHFLQYRPRSRAELLEYLRARDIPDEISEEVIDRLAANGYVDDRAFAAWWVENRSQHRPRSKWALHWELTQRGVATEIITEATASVDDQDLAIRVAVSKASRYQGLEYEPFAAKIAGILRRRGFTAEIIGPAVREAWRSRGESADHADSEAPYPP